MYTSKNIIRKELVEIGRRIAEKDLIIGPGGNTSARLKKHGKDIIYLKASGKCFENAVKTDYIGIDPVTGNVVDGNLKPTCETNMHLICYNKRDDVHAVIHSHPPFATAYAMLGKPLKAFTPDFVAVVGLEIPVDNYVPPAGEEIALSVGKYIGDHNGVLLMNHGLITVGANLKEAFYRTMVIEDAAKVIFYSKVFGKMKYFTSEEAEAINRMGVEKYRREMMQKK